ncbi:unnamed protein product [Tuber melanosporum]|uniref:tRNA wybutosine-synthesizing protein 3 n=1 Tax=Tuber melanosporum (strain Mel28) TaxID=656061 RepID=D5GQ32_TUBMM|nr:uncharacterized protein GSTUM_00012179001 [Tuber melanosporum]CAZ86625.1 unnamed protein product [Tuber melanosporum]
MSQQLHARFAAHKTQILAEILSPGPDASPKGSIDLHILPLINRLNEHRKIITTSSCSGRISVFLEGSKKLAGEGSRAIGEAPEPDEKAEFPSGNAGMGGKGGGKWLFVSHDPVDCNDMTPREVCQMLLGGHVLGLGSMNNQVLTEPVLSEAGTGVSSSTRLVHMKFEPMILHIQTLDLQTARIILTAALSAGFRESGIMNPGLTEHSFPMIAIRCNGLVVDSIIGVMNVTPSGIKMIVDENYLKTMMLVSSLRFEDNKRRIDAFSGKIEQVLFNQGQAPSKESKGERKIRKREEGLRRQRILRAAQAHGESQL